MISHSPAIFGCHQHHGSGDIIVFICNMILHDHMTNRLSNMERSPSRLVNILPRLVAIGTMVVDV